MIYLKKGIKSIRSQMIIYIGIFVVFPLCIGLFALEFYLQKTMTDSTVNYYSAALRQIKENADQMIEITNYASSMTLIDDSILENLRIIDNSMEGYESYKAKSDISKYLLEMESSVLNAVGGKVAILSENGYLIGGYTRENTRQEYDSEMWYQKILDNGRKSTYCPQLEVFFNEMDSSTTKRNEHLYIGRRIVDYSGKSLGIIMIQLSGEKIWEKFGNLMNDSDKSCLYFMDCDGSIYMSYNRIFRTLPDAEEIVQALNLEKQEVGMLTLNDETVYMGIGLENSSHLLLYSVPKNIFMEDVSTIQHMMLIMIIALSTCTIILMIYFSGRLSRPLIRVVEILEDSHSEMLEIKEPKNTFLEIQKFVMSYNNACIRIKELIEKVKEEVQLKERARYEMLMSQISPHFMFNTVNSIRIMAKEESAALTEKALESLGEILHAVYSGKEGMTTIAKEISLLQAYINIMQMRFGNSFQYYNVIPAELYQYEIPAFTMQPIVENAILHGVRNIKAGQIIVSAVEYPEDFILSVFDNGETVDKSVMDRLLKYPNKNKSSFTGIGLYNVDTRLKMLYGESYGLIYNEQVKNGFEIWIRIPKKSLRK